MVVCFVVTLLIAVPVAYSLLFSVYAATWGTNLLPAPAVAMNMATGASSFILFAIPLFLTAGYLMNSGGLTSRLMALAQALVGHLRGGLAQVNVVSSVLFAGISGSSSADAAGVTKMLVPEMAKRGYPVPFACAVTASASILPNVIPPSISMLVYAAMSDVSVAKLFIGGYIPGFVIAGILMVTVHVMATSRGYDRPSARASAREVGRSAVGALPVLVLPIVIIGGMRFGVVTATEAGVVAVLWALVLGRAIYGELRPVELYRDLVDCGVDSALIGFLIAVSVPFGWILIGEQIPQKMVGWLLNIFSSQAGVLLFITVLLLLAGTVLEPAPAMLIFVPLLLPVVKQFGIDPIHFGVILIVNLLIGSLSPPVGILVFITAVIAKVPAAAVFRELNPFLAALILGLFILTYVPVLTTWLPRVLF